jgi:hypothetical protein
LLGLALSSAQRFFKVSAKPNKNPCKSIGRFGHDLNSWNLMVNGRFGFSWLVVVPEKLGPVPNGSSTAAKLLTFRAAFPEGRW